MAEATTGTDHVPAEGGGIHRRRFLTWMMAAPVLTVGAKAVLSGGREAHAQIPSNPQFGDVQDLGDQIELAGKPTEHMIELEVLEDSTVRLHLHRAEVGQGIMTAAAMLIAEEMEIPLEQVDVRLRDAAPELVFNQLTGGSTSIRTLYVPLRQAALAAREQLMAAAADEAGVSPDQLEMEDGQISLPGVNRWPIGAFTALAANYELPLNLLRRVKSFDEMDHIVGEARPQLGLREMVTGERTFTMDVDVPGARPMSVRRPPTIQGSPAQVRNADAVRAMSGVVDLVMLPTGVGVVAETFGQAEVAKNALEVDWNGGTVDGTDDTDIFDRLRRNQLPLSVPGLGPVLGAVDHLDFEFEFPFVSHAPLETNTAIADVREDSAELWAGLKIPIIALQDAARMAGLDESAVTCHVMPGGGSFGRRLFHDALNEAVIASRELGIPIKNLWTRLDDMRHGRGRPPSVHRLRVTTVGDDVLSYEHRMSGMALDAEHGLGEAVTAIGARTANLTFAQDLFLTLVKCPYDFGVTTSLLNEPNEVELNTGSWRSPYSNVVRVAEEVAVDGVAERLGEDAAEFRMRMLKDDRAKAVLQAVLEDGGWGRDLPDGVAQGIAVHVEYRSYSAWLVEVDARDPRDPRVTRSTCAVDVGNPINPSGLEQQMNGCLADGIGLALRLGNHIRDGAIVESSYSDFRITKQKHFPRQTRVIVMPPNTDEVGGAGELGLAGAAAAVANAFARATGRQVRSFPVNFDIDFDVVPDVPHHPTFDARGA